MKRERAMLAAVVLALGLSGAAWAAPDKDHGPQDRDARNGQRNEVQRNYTQRNDVQRNDRDERGRNDVRVNNDDRRFGDRDDHRIIVDRDDHRWGDRDDHRWSDRDDHRVIVERPYYSGPVYREPDYRPGVVIGFSGGNFAYDRGFADGLRDGSVDFRTGHSFRPYQDEAYRLGTNGWVITFGDRGLYQQAYRDAYLRGYSQGYRG